MKLAWNAGELIDLSFGVTFKHVAHLGGKLFVFVCVTDVPCRAVPCRSIWKKSASSDRRFVARSIPYFVRPQEALYLFPLMFWECFPQSLYLGKSRKTWPDFDLSHDWSSWTWCFIFSGKPSNWCSKKCWKYHVNRKIVRASTGVKTRQSFMAR